MSFDINKSVDGREDASQLTAYSLKNSLSISETSWLKDHGFQDMVVLPGSVYVELAAQEFIDRYDQRPQVFKNVAFERIFLVPELKSQEINIHVEENNRGLRLFFNDPQASPQENAYAKLEISQATNPTDQQVIDLEALQGSIPEQLDGETHYQQLLANGNQYGSQFKALEYVSNDQSQALGKVIVSDAIQQQLGHYFLHPVLMDACVQVLAAINKQSGQTFILKGFQQITVFQPLNSDFFCHAQLQRSGDKADVRAYDLQGNILMEALGVAFEYLENNTKSIPTAEKVNLAASFTIDPINDSLEFWAEKLGMPLNVEITPYNQIFQQLLDPSSSFYQGQALNVIALNLEDWAETRHTLKPHIEGQGLKEVLSGKETYQLPNGLTIAHLNKYETEYVFTEIFLDKSYIKHGIELNDGDVVFDIGANIGLFTMFVNQQCKDPHVYSFEPSPQVYDLLEANARIYGKHSKTFNVGVSDRRKEAEFTFYEKSSVFSSFNADEDLDRDAIRAVVHNMVKDSIQDDSEALDQFVDEMMEGRMESKHFTCQLLSISDFIDEHNIDHIDLLKIDAEKSELEIVHGIRDEHWQLIKQIVLEVHDTEGPVINEIREILTARGFEFFIEEETFLHNSGLFNIFAVRTDGVKNNGSTVPKERIQENIHTFSSALAEATRASGNPFLVISSPPSPQVKTEHSVFSVYNDLQNVLMSALDEIDNVYAIDHQSIAKSYPVEDYFDTQQNELGHIPYTGEYFTVLGTVIARKLWSLKSSPYKVIALDCDNTLWKGVIGEDGPEGIVLDEGHIYLQKFMKEQVAQGMLICLVSKNSEQDVLQVFENREDMMLSTDNVVSTRINWETKSQNLISLAEELNVGLDSFIFIDDNPMEVAEVAANCAGVLSLQLPSNSTDIPSFLNHLWAFDQLKVTEEDRRRTRMYQQNVKREQYRKQAPTLAEFLEGLNLQITLEPYLKENLPRISQLTQRTNQFNFTTIRRSEAEIQELVDSGSLEIFTVRVADRFGDYGLVGVAMFSTAYDAIELDTMLLSCRVLGKGVEHRMIQELGDRAAKSNLSLVRVPFAQTAKNEPAWKFLQSFGSDYLADQEATKKFELPVEVAKNLQYQAVLDNTISKESKDNNKSLSLSRVGEDSLHEIALSLNTVLDIQQAMKTAAGSKIVRSSSQAAPVNLSTIEKQILEVWEEVLHINGIGINDNFFDIGGTSLKGVQVIALVNQKLQGRLTIVNLFESPSIRLLAELFKEGSSGTSTAVGAGKERAQKRRDLRTKRRRRK